MSFRSLVYLSRNGRRAPATSAQDQEEQSQRYSHHCRVTKRSAIHLSADVPASIVLLFLKHLLSERICLNRDSRAFRFLPQENLGRWGCLEDEEPTEKAYPRREAS